MKPIILIILFASLASFGQDLGATPEEKRTALSEIRNRRTPDQSRRAVPALSDPDATVRATAAGAVVFLPVDEAAAVLIPGLADRDEFVRKETAFALGTVKSRTATTTLTSLARRDKSAGVRSAAIFALGEIGDDSALEFLATAIGRKRGSATEFERSAAAKAIGKIALAKQRVPIAAVTPESFLPANLKTSASLRLRDLTIGNEDLGRLNAALVAILMDPKEAADVRREAAFAIGAIAADANSALIGCVSAADYYLAEICREGLAAATNSK